MHLSRVFFKCFYHLLFPEPHPSYALVAMAVCGGVFQSLHDLEKWSRRLFVDLSHVADDIRLINIFLY